MLRQNGMRIERFFTQNLKNSSSLDIPYSDMKFKKVVSELRNIDGSTASKSYEFMAPESWSSLATDILARNYLRKRGIPSVLEKVEEKDVPSWLWKNKASENATFEGKETDARQVFDRLAGAWTYWGWKGGYFHSENDARVFYDEMRYILAHQMGAPNSPQWFNTGINWAYGIEGNAQGHYYFDEAEKEIKRATSAYERPQPHACFIQSVNDDLVNEGGIMDLWVREARLFKFGSGTGSNFSSLRGAGEKLSGGGYSSGLMSFLKIGDTAGGGIKSGGTTRRAAKMVILNIDHPDIEAFIEWKEKEEAKVLNLVIGSKIVKKYTDKVREAFKNKDAKELKILFDEAVSHGIPNNYLLRILNLLKYGVEVNAKEMEFGWESEAYASVSGQNSNNSVRVSDYFLNCVKKDEKFSLTNRTDGSVCKVLDSRYLWSLIGRSAWGCADPGLQFDDTINAWNTCANDERINGSNPCSEYMFLDDTACNLASMNLCKFIKKGSKFDLDLNALKYSTRLWILVLEISVYMAQFPSKAIAKRSYQYRTLGLGYGNLGAMLMQAGLSYDSDEGRNMAAGLTALMQGIAYETSSEIAKNLGAFERYENNKTSMMKVMKNHAIASSGGSDFIGLNVPVRSYEPSLSKISGLSDEVLSAWERVLEKGEKFGFRNAQVSVIAPTGTIGLVMDFKTTGVEPQFSQFVIKQLSGGGIFKMMNEDISKALVNLGYEKNQIEEIESYVAGRKNLDGNIALNTNWLLNKGFSKAEVDKVYQALEKAFDFSEAFNAWVLGESVFERLGLIDKVKQEGFDCLKELGATKAEIEEARAFCFGNMTIEGAPYLKQEHLPIFDCAVPCGKKGKRFLSKESHLNMMAAIQPFLSGAISKTINLPKTATIKDCEDSYMQAWELGLKSVALYRDGSKNSQVMMAASEKDFDFGFDSNEDNSQKTEEITGAKLSSENASINPSQEELKKDSGFIPFRRRGYTQHVMIGGSPLWQTTGEDSDGNLRNILLTFGQEGSTLRGWAGAWGRILSMYLQECGGSALVRSYKAFRHSRFEPMGEISGHPIIKRASSIPDYIVEDLANSYPEMMKSKFEEKKMPSQRRGSINKIKIGQETMYLIIGEDEQGRPREVFVAGMGNEGSDLRGWMSSCAKLISLFFQECGNAAVWSFINAFEGSSFDPSGFISGHEAIRSATSPLDYLAKYLKHHYSSVLSGEQLTLELNQAESKLDLSLESEGAEKPNVSKEIEIRSLSGYKVDEPCKSCKAFKLRYNGTCFICDNCFNTTGCS